MAECVMPTAVQGANFDLASDSPVFQRVRSVVADLSLRSLQLEMPELRDTDLSVPLSGIKPSLREPTNPKFDDVNLPTPQGGGLARATYQALSQAIHFAFDTPLVPQVTYRDGVAHIDVPSPDTPSAPLVYPSVALPGVPDAPVVDSPAAPRVEMLDAPVLLAHEAVTYTPSAIEPLSFPVEVQSWLATELEVAPIDYVPQVDYTDDASLIAKLKALLDRGDEPATWLIQQSLLSRADTRSLMYELRRAQATVFETAAARNIPLAEGATDVAVQVVSREVLDRYFTSVAKTHAEVLEATLQAVLSAIRQAETVEKYHSRLFVLYLHQNIDLYKRNVEAAATVFRALAAIYDAYQRVVVEHVQAYNRYLAAIEAQNSALAADTDALQARVQSYQASIAIYRAQAETVSGAAQVQTLQAQVERLPLQVYGSQVRAFVANMDVFKQNLSAYRQAIQNYAREAQMADDQIAAFESAVRAEASRGDVFEANVRAFARTVGVEQQRVRDYEQYVRSSVSALDAELDTMRAAISAERSYIGALSDIASANLRVVGAYDSIAKDTAAVVRDYNRASVGYTYAQNRVDLAQAELEAARKSIEGSAVAQEARLAAGRAAVQVRAGGALAQAASTIYNVGLSASGSTSHSVSGRDSGTLDTSIAQSYSWDCTKRQETTALTG